MIKIFFLLTVIFVLPIYGQLKQRDFLKSLTSDTKAVTKHMNVVLADKEHKNKTKEYMITGFIWGSIAGIGTAFLIQNQKKALITLPELILIGAIPGGIVGAIVGAIIAPKD